MKINKISTCLVLTLLLISNLAIAAPFASTSVSTISPCPSFCGGSGGASDFDFDGGEGLVTSFSSLNNSDGDGRAQALFVGASLLPELSAEAFSNSGIRSSRVSSHATGMQQYIYSGASNNVTLTALFDGVITDEARISGSLVVALASNGADVPMSRDFGTLVFEILPLTPDLALLGSDRSTLSSSGSVDDQLDLVFGVNNGDSIFVWADLIATGIRGGEADAFNTMTLSLSDPTGFTPQLGQVVNPVSEPSAFALFAIGLFGLGFVRPRKA